MKRIIVDFVAYRSVVVAVNDEDDAVDLAEDLLRRREPGIPWEYDNNCALEETSDEADNEYDVTTCPYCQTEYVEQSSECTCPNCGKCEGE